MPARKWPPTVHVHTPSGQDRIRVYVNGQRKDIWLGPTGSAEARSEYLRIVAEMERHGGSLPPRKGVGMSVNEVAEAFVPYAETKWGSEQGKTSLARVQRVLGTLRELYGTQPAADFDADKAETLRSHLIHHRRCGTCKPGKQCKACAARPGLCRRHVNQLMSYVALFFRWAARRNYIPASVWHSVSTVEPLEAGEEGVRETPHEQPPVPEADLAATLPLLRTPIRLAVELLLLTAARPDEILRLRPCDIDRTGKVQVGPGEILDTGGAIWSVMYSAEKKEHKTARHGRDRLILFGPQAQALLRPLLEKKGAEEYLFSPRDTVLERNAIRAAKARRPKRAVKKPRPVGAGLRERYMPDSFREAITDCCERHGITPWCPYRLRHNAATRLVAEFGWDVARIVLGHHSVSMTRRYALDDLRKAVEATKLKG